MVPSNLEKYVYLNCHHKIGKHDLEEIFASQLAGFPIGLGNDSDSNLADYWHDLTAKEKRIVIEQIGEKIIIGKSEINIEFGYTPHSLKTTAFGQQNKQGNETFENEPKVTIPEIPTSQIIEPLINEIEAAKFSGISRMTLLRKRKAGGIGFFRVGFWVLYSKEKHLLPFLQSCEK